MQSESCSKENVVICFMTVLNTSQCKFKADAELFLLPARLSIICQINGL